MDPSQLPLRRPPNLDTPPVPLAQRGLYIPQGPDMGCRLDMSSYREPMDQDERVLRNVKVEAPSFDGSLDFKEYLDWEVDIDHFFEWYDMSEVQKIKFAKIKLISQSKLYWHNLEHLAEHRRQESIETWEKKKERLRQKYLFTSYKQRLLDQWQKMTQGNRPVSEYIIKFDEFLMRCSVIEDRAITLSRFRANLWENI